MKLQADLVPATLLRRYKRFLADVELADGSMITAHVANPGAMLGLQAPGARVWLSKSPSKTRKLPFSWELIEADFGNGPELVGVNTMHPNAIVAEALAANAIPELAGYDTIRREVKYGAASRVDFLLEHPSRSPCYVEVKNVHMMRQPGLAEFPDSVTARGARHLDELAAMVATGARAMMLFVVQIGSSTAFALARDIDPAYGSAFDKACNAGVEAVAYTCRIDHGSIVLAGRVPIQP
ncbi:DNA/RNA nuclease SfsA [Tardiphaga sp. OK245]|jgi:sugar fermentation stimulation protein A|uniref:DNA/RNA nuclease SfsA n=1 Tax=Tardiphaga sp. OK245 TaxID=1855306 RepID=UPI0008A7580E|nr:DNA/RNA nuclease SfsA [Tardiphaga sp. OK245]SEI17887.1 sugar fermentation stimulation protein A [Tardiphaga sp. OK245]